MSFHKAPPPRRDRSDEFASFVMPPPKGAVLRRADGIDRLCIQVPKEEPARSEEYRRLVAAMDCAHCGRGGPSQCAHADSGGKGMGIKPSDFESMPLCADTPGRNGCHWLIGTSGMFSKEQRRNLEAKYVAATKLALLGRLK